MNDLSLDVRSTVAVAGDSAMDLTLKLNKAWGRAEALQKPWEAEVWLEGGDCSYGARNGDLVVSRLVGPGATYVACLSLGRGRRTDRTFWEDPGGAAMGRWIDERGRARRLTKAVETVTPPEKV